MQRIPDSELIGLKYGRLTVLEVVGRNASKKRVVRCLCECGKTHDACLSTIRSGNIRSCGCLRHGLSLTPEYYVWRTMKARCLNPKSASFHRYGGRGIQVCERWLSFDSFFADMGERPSPKHQIDRIDNEGHYSPENCRWSTVKEQGRNKSTNRLITFNGETLPAVEWCERMGLNPSGVAKRLKSGWPLHEAVTTPKFSFGQRRKTSHG